MRSTQSILDAARQIAKQDSNSLESNPEFAHYNITKNLVAKMKTFTQMIKSPVATNTLIFYKNTTK